MPRAFCAGQIDLRKILKVLYLTFHGGAVVNVHKQRLHLGGSYRTRVGARARVAYRKFCYIVDLLDEFRFVYAVLLERRRNIEIFVHIPYCVAKRVDQRGGGLAFQPYRFGYFGVTLFRPLVHRVILDNVRKIHRVG